VILTTRISFLIINVSANLIKLFFAIVNTPDKIKKAANAALSLYPTFYW
jgi:hypothetical protein